MKLKIGKNGTLYIWRVNEWCKQDCAYRRKEFCGDDCPLFREPFERNGVVILQICDAQLQVRKPDFCDKREKKMGE